MRSLGPLGALLVGLALAGVEDAGAACQIGAFDPATSVFFLDANDNGLWDGAAGGDATSEVASFAGPGTPLVGDWNGDGVDDTGKLVGSRFFLDLDGDRDWTGNVGGDRNTSFGASFGLDEPIVGDWNGDGRDEIGLHENGRFILDWNGNGVWDGVAGGDRDASIRVFAGGVAVVGDWDDDGSDDLGHADGVGYAFLDSDGDGDWEGTFGDAPIRSVAIPVVGDWLGIGRVSIGSFDALRSMFKLDGNANFHLGSALEDPNGSVGLFTGVGTPLVCDWDGDGDTDLGKAIANGRFVLDRNGNRRWDGAALGDRSTLFDVGAPAMPLAGRWVAP